MNDELETPSAFRLKKESPFHRIFELRRFLRQTDKERSVYVLEYIILSLLEKLAY